MGNRDLWRGGCAFVAMKGFHYYLDYLKHSLTANSRHGTHSPFVYRLVDEVVYRKREPGEQGDKASRLIERLIKWFRPQQVVYIGAAEVPDGPLDFIIVRRDDTERINDSLNQLWPQLHVDSVLVVEGIYRNAGLKRLWQSIQAKPRVTVTVDLFHVGLVFFHLGQAKEHFQIRY